MRTIATALAFLMLGSAAGATERAPFESGRPWKSIAALTSPTAELSILDGERRRPAGKVRDWFRGHDQAKNDCRITGTTQDDQIWIVCVRRGLYGNPPIKLVFIYQATIPHPNELLINFGTTGGSPLIGKNLADHFNDELQD